MTTLFAYLVQATKPTEGPMLGPFQLLPQSIGAWLAIVMSGIALWAHIKQRAAKSVDLDGLGSRVGKLQTDMATIMGSVSTLTQMMQSFVATSTSQAERQGELQRSVNDFEADSKELKREIIVRLERLQEGQQLNSNRLTRLEERLKITS